MRINQPVTGRDFKFAQGAGDNILAGTSDELPLADPFEAADRVNALDPPVASDNRATISGSGNFNNTLFLPQFAALDAEATSIISADPICLDLGGNHTARIGALVNLAEDGVCIKSDSNKRVRSVTTSLVVVGDNGIGYQVSGDSDDSSYDLTQGELRADGDVMIEHTATSPSPIRYNFELTELFNTNQTFIRHEPGAGSAETIVEVEAIQLGVGATQVSTEGSLIFDNVAGNLVIHGDVLQAETITRTRSGAVTSLDSQAVFGNTIVEDGGQAIYRSVGIITGNIEVEGSGQFIAKPSFMVGQTDIELGATLFLESARYDGDIDNEGTLFVNIDRQTGEITGSGTTHGLVNGVPFGQNRQKPFEIIELFAFSSQDQAPDGRDDPLQIEFGEAQGSSSDSVEITEDGDMLIHRANQYKFTFLVVYGRTGSGGVALLFFRLLVDGKQVGMSIPVKLDGSGDNFPFQFTRRLNLTAGQVVKVEFVRDGQGNDSGGLFASTPTLSDWNMGPSASVSVSSQSLIQDLNLIAVLPGDSGDNFSTPDSVDASITGDIDIQMRVSATDWTPATTETLLSKWQDSGFEKSYLFQLTNTGALRIFLSEDGVITKGPATSSVPTGFINGTLHWVRFTWDATTGDVNFLISDDDTDDPALVNWVALGVTQTLLPSAAIFDSAADVEIGSHNQGTAVNFDGSVSRASIFKGIDGTLVVDFNPQDYRGNSTFPSRLTGETWTLNGNVDIEV